MKNDDWTISQVVGHSVSRVDAALKCSGGAHYTSDRRLPGMLIAVPVSATIAKGQLLQLDTTTAATMPGVHAVLTRESIGHFYRVNPKTGVKIDEARPPLDDDTIRYYGQYIAVVVADTFEQASAAAAIVEMTARYRQSTPNVAMTLSPDAPPKTESERGNAEGAFASAPVKIDHVYTTPIETHNPIELHASVADYDGQRFTLYESTQAVMNHQSAMAQMLGVRTDQVRIVTEYLGGGFGGKLWPWTHSLLAAGAARQLRRPIKLVVSRKMMFEAVGHRPNTQQRVRLSASNDGRLQSLQQDYIAHGPVLGGRKEDCGEATPYLYSTSNLRVTSAMARRDIAPDTSMRGPGAVPGLFAIESAMDELALALNKDPVALRLLNEPAIDESLGVPFSSRHLAQCLTTGADKFGWSRRNAGVGAMRDSEDDTILGWGVASCSWMARRIPAQASVAFHDDGTLRVASGTQDIGTGTYTVLAQMAAQQTDVPLSQVVVAIGDSYYPAGPMSGGSMATASLVPAVSAAARDARDRLLDAAASAEGSPYKGQARDTLQFSLGRVHRQGEPAAAGIPFERLLRDTHFGHIAGTGKSGASSADADAKSVSIHSYGAHFVEVAWQPSIGRLRIKRVVTVIDGGKIINPKTGRNQIEGAIMMGVGMAMFEHTEYDPRSGAPINSNLADYIVAANADTPEIDVTFLDHPDLALNELGARGIGEIGLAGFAAAVANAVHHATGIRVRDLPIKIEALLPSTVSIS